MGIIDKEESVVLIKMSGCVLEGGINKRQLTIILDGKDISSFVNECIVRFSQNSITTAELAFSAEFKLEGHNLLEDINKKQRLVLPAEFELKGQALLRQ